MNYYIQFYYDKENETVNAASYYIKKYGVQPARHPERFEWVGGYQPNQNFPYINGSGQVVREKYGKEEILLEVK